MGNVNLIDLTHLIEAILGVLALVAMKYLFPWAKAKMSKERQEDFALFFDIAVMAAEKLYGAKQGDKKLAQVEEWAKARGIKIDTMRLKMFVNASIKKMEQAEPPKLITGEASEGVLIEEDEESEGEDEEPQREEA